MKVLRNLKLVNHITFVALALCFSAVLGRAQSTYRGTFTLPFEVQWGAATLPAGDYTLTLESANAGARLLYVRGEGKTAIIQSGWVDTEELSAQSQLTVTTTGGRRVITAFEAGQLGLNFGYAVPKAKMAQAPTTQAAANDAPMVARLEIHPVR